MPTWLMSLLWGTGAGAALVLVMGAPVLTAFTVHQLG
jgi:hypothetical protein